MKLTIIIPWLLSIMTVVVGIWQFSVKQAEANRQPFLQKQLELTFEATDAAARLASETDPAEWEKARKTFWRLYWGPLSIVEDRAVEAAMVKMGSGVPKQPVDNPKLPMTALQKPSYDLAHAVRKLVLSSWKVDLPALQAERSQ